MVFQLKCSKNLHQRIASAFEAMPALFKSRYRLNHLLGSDQV